MRGIYGILLLDGAEVVLRIYRVTQETGIELVFAQDRDLYTFNLRQPVMLMDIVEMFANALFSAPLKEVDHWQIVSRNMPEDLVNALSYVIAKPIEELDLVAEQELLCQGILFNQLIAQQTLPSL